MEGQAKCCAATLDTAGVTMVCGQLYALSGWLQGNPRMVVLSAMVVLEDVYTVLVVVLAAHQSLKQGEQEGAAQHNAS